METRTRRLRSTDAVRRLTRETRVSADALVYPLFVREGHGIIEPLPSMDNQTRYSADTVAQGVESALSAGVRSFLLFGLPEKKDAVGSGAYAVDGVVQQALRNLKQAFADDAYLITDVCLCEYTDHGHCGLIKGQQVDNDSTLPLLAATAVSHAEAGADMVAPSGMMDKTVSSLRSALDDNGFLHIPIMSYAAKYASAFYGPFRDAAGSAPQFGDRKAYQMDYHNSREAIRRIQADIDEGADLIIVKPALPCLDIINQAADWFNLPIAAYSVSGEYAMVKAAASAGLIDEYKVMCESAIAVWRAGANILISYFASPLAVAISKGDIG
ncbi:MAG: porphobilinogen synthase [Coriobacteriales bacterium]|nr:porphobilinogen synthase [Coriobacteriales bacterium]